VSKDQLVIATDGPFKVFCNTCGRWVEGDRINIDGTHDADESKPIRGYKMPPPERTEHVVWEPSRIMTVSVAEKEEEGHEQAS